MIYCAAIKEKPIGDPWNVCNPKQRWESDIDECVSYTSWDFKKIDEDEVINLQEDWQIDKELDPLTVKCECPAWERWCSILGGNQGHFTYHIGCDIAERYGLIFEAPSDSTQKVFEWRNGSFHQLIPLRLKGEQMESEFLKMNLQHEQAAELLMKKSDIPKTPLRDALKRLHE